MVVSLAVALVVVVFLLLRHQAEQARSWTVERRELLNRIQHPQIVPQERPETFATPEPEVDEIELVGTISYDQNGD